MLVDHRTDVYSLGMTLYELLTLCPAFRNDAGPAMLRRIEQDDPPRPRQLNPDVPLDLENVVWKAMAKTRDERYATAADMADDLQRFIDGVPTVAKPPRLLERASKWVRRHRTAVTAAAVGGVAALCVLVTASLLVLQENAQKQAALEAAQRNLQRAEANFRQAKDVVDQFGARLAERLAGIPGAEPLRQELLGETLRYYQGFIEQAGDDPVLQEDLAVTYSKIGGITERTGRIGEAVAAYRSSAAILEQLLARQPDSREAAGRLALCRSNLGLLLARSGKTAEGLREVTAARQMQQRLAARFPADTDCAAALALTENNLGLLQSQTGAAARAEQSYLAAVETQRELVRQRPERRQVPARSGRHAAQPQPAPEREPTGGSHCRCRRGTGDSAPAGESGFRQSGNPQGAGLGVQQRRGVVGAAERAWPGRRVLPRGDPHPTPAGRAGPRRRGPSRRSGRQLQQPRTGAEPG